MPSKLKNSEAGKPGERVLFSGKKNIVSNVLNLTNDGRPPFLKVFFLMLVGFPALATSKSRVKIKVI